MERRSEPRFTTHQPVQVAVEERPEDRWDGIIIDVSGRGMKILTARSAALNSRIQLTSDGLVVLAHVCFCKQEGDLFALGVEVDGAHWQESSSESTLGS
jgi:hypothetical protein